MNTTLRNTAITCAYAFTCGATWAGAQTPNREGRLERTQVAAWREDLTYMAREMSRRHRNLYHTMSRATFDSAITSLHRRIPTLERHRIIVELARIVALVGDGHTNIAPTRDPKIGFHTLPIKLYFFKDGLFVRAAHQAHSNVVGARVVRIGQRTPEEAYRRVRELVGRDNEMGIRFFAPFLLAMPEVLHALDLSESRESATFELEHDGQRRTVNLRAHGPAPMMPSDTDVSWWPDSGWVDMRPALESSPLWLKRDPRDHYWFEYDSTARLVYLQLNKVGNKEAPDQESLSQFSRRLLAFLDTARVERLTLDLRLNRGGDGTLIPPLLVSLIKARKLDRPGKLFVIIGRSTFSAAQFLVNDLERYTEAVFVGEPTGGKANSYGDSRKIILPHSGITVRVSTLWWQEDPRDRRQWTTPDIAAELTSTAYRKNEDPALQVVLNYRAEPSVVERMADALATQGFGEALRRYRAYRADPRFVFVDTENELNSFGYHLLERKQTAEAIQVFELNVAEHPNSANTYDSLGEAYMLAGRRDDAIRNYRKSLQLDPANENARAKLEELRSR